MTTSVLADALRLGLGSRVVSLGPRPAGPITLYDFEACPYCRKVREAISMLDLVVDVRPCPKGGARFRPELQKLGMKMRVPTLVDGGAVLQESERIVEHLFQRYGTGRPPLRARLGTLGTWTSSAISGARLQHGKWARSSRETSVAYELFSYEASAEASRVRETLTELEVGYRLLSVAEGSTRRQVGLTIPTLRAPGLELRGVDAILVHLEKEHAA